MQSEDPTAYRKRRTREERARYRSRLQGLKIARSRRRDPQALDYGLYAVGRPGAMPKDTTGSEYTLTLDEVEAILDGTKPVPGDAAPRATTTS